MSKNTGFRALSLVLLRGSRSASVVREKLNVVVSKDPALLSFWFILICFRPSFSFSGYCSRKPLLVLCTWSPPTQCIILMWRGFFWQVLCQKHFHFSFLLPLFPLMDSYTTVAKVIYSGARWGQISFRWKLWPYRVRPCPYPPVPDQFLEAPHVWADSSAPVKRTIQAGTQWGRRYDGLGLLGPWILFYFWQCWNVFWLCSTDLSLHSSHLLLFLLLKMRPSFLKWKIVFLLMPPKQQSWTEYIGDTVFFSVLCLLSRLLSHYSPNVKYLFLKGSWLCEV